MGIGWPEYTLGDLCKFKYGHMPRKTDLCDDGYPVFSGYRIVGNATTYHYEEPEIIVVARGVGGTGDVKMSPPKCFLTNISIVAKVVSSEVDKKFLYYRLAGPKLWELRTGSAQAQITIDRLQRYELRLPPLPTQRKIAVILSAYDDLIENNLRRIKILEKMAQILYREWFVKFRFPGHQHARLTDSSHGRIPEGWEVVRFRDLLQSSLGGDWGLDEPSDIENVPVFIIRGTDFADIVNGSSLRTPKRFIGPSSQAKRQLMAGDLLIENSINAKSRCVGTTLLITDGVLQRLRDRVIAASFCKVYRFKRPSLATLAHLHMRHLYEEGRMAFYQNVAANGIGNFQSQRFLESEHLVFPSDPEKRQEMLASLNDLTSSTFADQVFALRRTRDLLLPRLISGEVDVSELDIAVPEEASA